MPIEIKNSGATVPKLIKPCSIIYREVYKIHSSSNTGLIGKICIPYELWSSQGDKFCIFFLPEGLPNQHLFFVEYFTKANVELLHLPDKVVTISF